MHFSSVAALLAFSSISYAAPLANQNDLNRRQIAYQVVNVDGESSGSTAPEFETVTETLKSTVTAPGSPAAAQTVTVTATPSRTPSSTPVASSSTPIFHPAPPPGESFLPAGGNGFFRRGLNAAGNPALFAQNYVSSSSASWPSYTPSSSSVSTPTLAARQFGSWSSSVPVPSSSTSVPASSASPLVARQAGVWSSSSSVATPSSTPSVTPSAYVYARGYTTASSSTSSSSASVNVSPTPSYVKRNYSYSSSASSSTPSSNSSIPRTSALLY